MATDDEQSDDTVPGAWAPVGDPPTPVPFDRRDYGDAEQLAELAGADEAADEPVTVVDEPVPAPPYDRTQKRRNQRALP
ncbi:hypothetical protein [Micromonospora sp. KC723]|uniref:hypothetical protein n=1 Tax=Micromonospora sp. KC723 TaxID=2530381 RepID=UPI001FB612C4|nr:hypothetical protein [Micromonospora sp. KC723]